MEQLLAPLKCEQGQFTTIWGLYLKHQCILLPATDTCLAATYSRTVQCWIILWKSYIYNIE